VISLKVSDNHVQMQKDRSIRRQGALNCTGGCEVNAADLHSFRWHNELPTGPIAKRSRSGWVQILTYLKEFVFVTKGA